MNILMATTECVPFVKVGGLADVAGTLPKYLEKAKHDVRIILPKYQSIDGKKYNLPTLPYKLQVQIGKNTESFRLKYCLTEDNISVYFIENMRFFNSSGVYGASGLDYADNKERIYIFSKSNAGIC
jgi:starch synthase